MTGERLRPVSRLSRRGQSTVEVVAILPLVFVVALALLQVLAAGLAGELADHAAEAGAVAILQGRDPREAAFEALPGWSRDAADVRVREREVTVRLRPPSISAELARLLDATAVAHAGPERR